MGPVFYDTQSIAGGAAVDVVNSPASGSPWIYRRLPWPAALDMAFDVTSTAVVVTCTIGSDMQIGPENPVQSGGVAGVFPTELAQFQQLVGGAGDLISLLFRNTNPGAITVNTVIKLQPVV